MKDYKEFLIKLQTLDVKVTPKKLRDERTQPELSIYTISHQNPHLSRTFKNEMKELKELALVDILNLPGEQVQFQLHRLSEFKELFHKFWQNLNNSYVPIQSEDYTGLLYSLHLSDIFIVRELTALDYAEADRNFINDLQDSITFRQEVVDEFEQSVFKIIQKDKAPEKPNSNASIKKEASLPVLRHGIAEEFHDLIKDYFNPGDQSQLKKLLTNRASVNEPLFFKGAGNQLADAFKQLFDSNLIVGCNKTELENWIRQNFQYRDKGLVKSYTEKYLQDIISSNTKACQSPILDIRKNGVQFFLAPLTRNNKNNKI